MNGVHQYFPWKMWAPAALVVTFLTALTAIDLHNQMRKQMTEVADQMTSVAVGQLAAILSAAQELLRATEAKLNKRADFGLLVSQPEKLGAVLADIERTAHGVGFQDLAVIDPSGQVVALAGDHSLADIDSADYRFMRLALEGDDFVLSEPIEVEQGTAGEIAPLVHWIETDKGERVFLLMTVIDVRFLDAFRSRLTSSLIKHVALLDRTGEVLVGSWPFSDEILARIEIRKGVGSFDLVAAAGFNRGEVLSNVKSELLLLMLTYITSILSITALSYAYAFRSQVGTVLRQIVEQKDVLHREAQHRVSGALQLISSLVSLQVREADDERVSQALDTIKHRIAAILAVNGKLSGDVDGRQVDLGIYLRAICDDLAASFDQRSPETHLTASLSSVLCDGDKAVRIGLIVNELVTNAYRHGLPGSDGSVVRVRLALEDDRYQITVSDDGVGLADPAENADAGIGLELVSLLAEQLDSSIERVPSDKGTTWRLEGAAASLRPSEN
jgi:two-component sensor histidine kinase